MLVVGAARYDTTTTIRTGLDRWLAPGPVFAGLLVLAFLRSPHVLLTGRFWAEEGSIHYAEVHLEGGLAGLTFIDQRAGYLNLIPNIGTWLAGYLPLLRAPLVTGWLSFAVLATILWIVLAWPSDLLPQRRARITAAVLVLLGPAAHPEVWLNTINSQTSLGILGVALLFVRLDDLSERQYGVSVGALVVGALSGLYTTVLTPLFVLRALRDRTMRTIGHAVALGAVTAFQGILVLTSRTSGNLEETKLTIPSPRELITTFGGFHISPIVAGREATSELGERALAGGVAWIAVVVLVTAVIGALLLVAVRHVEPTILLTLTAAFVIVEVFVQVGAWGPADGRYAVVPLGIVSLAIAHVVGTADRRWNRPAGLVLAAAAVVVGVGEYWLDGRNALRCLDCPDWAEEVERWEDGDSTRVQIWPYPPWPFSPWHIELGEAG